VSEQFVDLQFYSSLCCNERSARIMCIFFNTVKVTGLLSSMYVNL